MSYCVHLCVTHLSNNGLCAPLTSVVRRRLQPLIGVEWEVAGGAERGSIAEVASLLLHRVSQHEDDRISSQEHLRDESVLVDRLGLLLALAGLRLLGPHLLHVLEDHVAVAVESLHATEELLVVAAVDQHLAEVGWCRSTEWKGKRGASEAASELHVSTVTMRAGAIVHELPLRLPFLLLPYSPACSA